MREWAQHSVDEAGGRATVTITGPLTVASVGKLDPALREMDDESVQFVDLSGAGRVDTVGAWIVYRFARDHHAEIIGGSEQAEVLLDAVERAESSARIKPERPRTVKRVVEHVGELVVQFVMGVRRNIGFLGMVMMAMGNLLMHPRRFRMKALVRQMELVGVSSLPIIGLMSFLIGIVIAQQGAVQLQQFGAETLTINLVGRITLRELGVLMTAIMVAGRSGSAFAAQLGTMNLTEEIDAMRTIGVSPAEALIIPRILAAVLMMPLLGFYACVMAVIGGAVVGDILLDIPFLTFLARIQEVVPTYDFWVGTVKAPVFGIIIAMSGCYQGMQVKGNAEEVGLRTTMAVVQAIFLVIVLDAFFAVFFTQVGWA
ncbi:ABC transporter permease [Aurantiacibacter spongiae]|uniref:ABC transporter permease n=1 Tax=Aurantiacibacter spongiae TaxID=2488860 RepID=A0A3N5DJU6_9SPHN|nr:ABC transporter permease [Aurantiacibacter spongiae]RPF71982.1 ABC transporter permease [Aurantiacibacter spongiae]